MCGENPGKLIPIRSQRDRNSDRILDLPGTRPLGHNSQNIALSRRKHGLIPVGLGAADLLAHHRCNVNFDNTDLPPKRAKSFGVAVAADAVAGAMAAAGSHTAQNAAAVAVTEGKKRAPGKRLPARAYWVTRSAGNGRKPTSAPPHPGCWSVAPRRPHRVQRAKHHRVL